ncbi:MAG: class I SAM-dependent methyltransferase [Candidatus Omnitrophica bacterium]|nr:class I SAM-dependent methyltransferase [Candidatus Omnitrophota bacterium]
MPKGQSERAELFKKATSSELLANRAEVNRRYETGDFNSWSDSLLGDLSFRSALDVCCGTGNQLALYAKRPKLSLLAGVDVSAKAIDLARKRLDGTGAGAKILLKSLKMEEMFSDPELKDLNFDIISCFYGLYYTSDIEGTLQSMAKHLSDKGAILIVGPYGENNASLFELLSRYFKLPELVLRSSRDFMEKDVYPLLKKEFDVKKEYFVNRIVYPDAKALIDYWKASTFYFPEFERDVVREMEGRFIQKGEFVVEKHVTAYIAKRGP